MGDYFNKMVDELINDDFGVYDIAYPDRSTKVNSGRVHGRVSSVMRNVYVIGDNFSEKILNILRYCDYRCCKCREKFKKGDEFVIVGAIGCAHVKCNC